MSLTTISFTCLALLSLFTLRQSAVNLSVFSQAFSTLPQVLAAYAGGWVLGLVVFFRTGRMPPSVLLRVIALASIAGTAFLALGMYAVQGSAVLVSVALAGLCEACLYPLLVPAIGVYRFILIYMIASAAAFASAEILMIPLHGMPTLSALLAVATFSLWTMTRFKTFSLPPVRRDSRMPTVRISIMIALAVVAFSICLPIGFDAWRTHPLFLAWGCLLAVAVSRYLNQALKGQGAWSIFRVECMVTVALATSAAVARFAPTFALDDVRWLVMISLSATLLFSRQASPA
jgi:hypothetical protein